MVDPGEAEVFERLGGKLSEGLALGVGRIEPALRGPPRTGREGKA